MVEIHGGGNDPAPVWTPARCDQRGTVRRSPALRVDQRPREQRQRPDPRLQPRQPDVFASSSGLARRVFGRVQSAMNPVGRTGVFANTPLSLATITTLTALNAIVLFGGDVILLQTRREGADLL
ncbi:hypothetical protein [Dinoroseobacter sp. S375]|uniref:hypothetical protein n=1 Tax=Dinoroseobacter sp. S375 TaxID=3415136 RepID=UPI003C7B839B